MTGGDAGPVRIAVIGCGAIGSLYAAHLARVPGVEVWAVDRWAEHVDAIESQGLRVTGLLGALAFVLSGAVAWPASSAAYAGAQPHDRVRIARDLDYEINGRHVLVVEDIVNTGLGLDYVLDELRRRGPASLEVVTLLDRPLRRLVGMPVRYVGFQIPNDYVVGYGLDYRELYRNLPFICTLRPSVYEIPIPVPAPEG